MAETYGVQFGATFGVGFGINSIGVTKDGGSGIYCPANLVEWNTILQLAGIPLSKAPSSTWTCQEASGNLTDSIGTTSLTKFGGPIYQNAVSGWSRKAIAQSSTDDFFTSAAGNITTTSHMLLAYFYPNTAPAATYNVIDMGATVSRNARINATPVYTAIGIGDAQVAGTGAANPGTVPRPVILQVDRTNSAVRVITDQEVIAPAYTAPVGGAANINFGPNATGAVSGRYLYGALFVGAAAEMSTAQIHALYLTLGWTLGW